MKSLTVPAEIDQLDEVTAFFQKELAAADCPERARFQIRLAVEEIFVNISSYAYKPEDGLAEVRCEVTEDPLRVVVQFLDSGKPFDPLAREDADTSEDALMGREGGLGIFLVKSTMDSVEYAYEGGKNILTIRKNL